MFSQTVRRWGVLTASLVLAVAVSLSCGGSGTDKGGAYDPTDKIVDLPAGADPAVSAEEGGAGFEEIAAGLGYQTYVPAPEDMKYFGDPRAKKGGRLTTWVSRFPNTMRVIGRWR